MIFKIFINLIVFSFIIYALFIIVKKITPIYKKIIYIILFLIITWCILFSVDYILTQNQKLPIFCTKLFGLASYQDGGTVEYFGLGYKVIDFHRIVYRENNWGNQYKFEKKYICPWFVSYEEAFEKIKQQLFLNVF